MQAFTEIKAIVVAQYREPSAYLFLEQISAVGSSSCSV